VTPRHRRGAGTARDLMTTAISVDVQNASTTRSAPDAAEIRSWVEAVISATGGPAPAELSVRIVDEAEGRALNSAWRGRDKATNVLSFGTAAALASLPAGMPRCLGDIVLCGPIVEREAEEQGKPVADHWAHLLVHGTLHLLGYDHEREEDARDMEALETGILASRGLGDPYAT